MSEKTTKTAQMGFRIDPSFKDEFLELSDNLNHESQAHTFRVAVNLLKKLSQDYPDGFVIKALNEDGEEEGHPTKILFL